jgi:beta-lactamase superfamily II metal-dependent hydrolase
LTPTPAVVGQSYTWGPISSTVLNPQVVPAGTQNKDSVVLLLNYGSTRFLFSGDIDSTIEQVIVNGGRPSQPMC